MMRAVILALALGFAGSAALAASRPPLHDPVSLNIGLACQWQQKCMRSQQKAMKRALSYVKKSEPPTWRIHMCNRNASRKRGRVDWVGFENCIRNAALVPQRQAPKRRPRRIA
ncbi:hypothetical protein H9L13_03665 [Sphingomonas lutea]|uniref:Uncharacterized protein n=1 Tax=Sphingomonas lutea TaxID=1045317 RepID=A0A7G9SJJ3_9SPHN|nr:hypothetical protein [Sphingomonas lutea]QNN68018.1 hypothetical protein H9L13_03665 [Sphingomonas lutea]